MSEDTQRVTHLPDHQGEDYLDVMGRIHAVLHPRTYFEVGTWTGNSLKLANCRSIAIDPHFQITTDVVGRKPECHLFQMPSDEFFKYHSPKAVFGDTVDFAFLDGMHLFECVLRDFINIESNCSRNSIIALHDCLPPDAYIASRKNDLDEQKKLSTKPGWWTGDVWKILPVLRKYRPDLVMVCLDAPPTGLVLVTGLYPESRILRDKYFDIVREFEAVSLLDYGLAKLHAEAAVQSTRKLQAIEEFGPIFWL